MDILASFLDPNDNGFDVADAVPLLALILGIAGALWAVFKFFLIPAIENIVDDKFEKAEERLVKTLHVATAPIQEIANGGLSLPDVAKTSLWNKAALKAIADAQGITLPPDPKEH